MLLSSQPWFHYQISLVLVMNVVNLSAAFYSHGNWFNGVVVCKVFGKHPVALWLRASLEIVR